MHNKYDVKADLSSEKLQPETRKSEILPNFMDVLNSPTLYEIHLPYMEFTYLIWNSPTLYGIHLPYMEFTYLIWNSPTLYGI